VGASVGAGGERPYRADQRCAALNARMDAGSEFRAGELIRQRRSAEIALLRLGNMRANGVQSLLVSPPPRRGAVLTCAIWMMRNWRLAEV
jgi:hypothetical protein